MAAPDFGAERPDLLGDDFQLDPELLAAAQSAASQFMTVPEAEFKGREWRLVEVAPGEFVQTNSGSLEWIDGHNVAAAQVHAALRQTKNDQNKGNKRQVPSGTVFYVRAPGISEEAASGETLSADPVLTGKEEPTEAAVITTMPATQRAANTVRGIVTSKLTKGRSSDSSEGVDRQARMTMAPRVGQVISTTWSKGYVRKPAKIGGTLFAYQVEFSHLTDGANLIGGTYRLTRFAIHVVSIGKIPL